MVRVLVLAVLVLNSATLALDYETTTLGDLVVQQTGTSIHQVSLGYWSRASSMLEIFKLEFESHFGKPTWLPVTDKLLQYLETIHLKIISELESDVANVTLQILYEDLKNHCPEYRETFAPKNTTCSIRRVWKTLTLKLTKAIEVGLENVSRDCGQQLLPLCSGDRGNCTLAYRLRIEKLLAGYVQEANDLGVPSSVLPLHLILVAFLIKSLTFVSIPYYSAASYLMIMGFYFLSVPSIEPFDIENLVRSRTLEGFETALYNEDSIIQSVDQMDWGIVKSNAGSVGNPCSGYRYKHPRGSPEYVKLLHHCTSVSTFQLVFDLIRCVSAGETSKPLTWSTASSSYYHSQCLCVAYNGTECGVKAPPDVDPRLYCLSVLLRDFQRQVSHRPAVTYLDYALMTRVPLCQFTNLLQSNVKSTCTESKDIKNFPLILSVQCYFNGLVNKRLNCSQTPRVNTYNSTSLCALQHFADYVVCDGGSGLMVPVPYYAPGDSPLVQVLTFLDALVRVLTLATYLACAQLRNLPGKLLIGYQVTAMLRLVAVRASFEDLALAVRLDVTFDLASTLWLTAYLQFLTSSIRTLRLPDSLTTAEALVVLLRCALFGWALPAALSATFFWLDEALDSRLMVGQLLFVLCNYVALLANLFMFFYNSHMYCDIKRDAFALKVGGKARSVLADLLNFALKTSVLSGAGIIFRLLFTQIQGLEHLLSYYHALGTLQALLFFGLYGCNTEARCFWRRFLFRVSRLWRRRQNTSV